MDGKVKSPDGKTAAMMMPPAFGLAGVNQHTWAGGWGTVTYWNAYVANTQMYGQGLSSIRVWRMPNKYPVAAKAGWGHKRDATGLDHRQVAGACTSINLRCPRPRRPQGSFDTSGRARGEALFNGKATCSHVPRAADLH